MTVNLEDLKNNMCKWPYGDPKDEDFHFCGAKIKPEDDSYCEQHMEEAYRPSARKSRKS